MARNGWKAASLQAAVQSKISFKTYNDLKTFEWAILYRFLTKINGKENYFNTRADACFAMSFFSENYLS